MMMMMMIIMMMMMMMSFRYQNKSDVLSRIPSFRYAKVMYCLRFRVPGVKHDVLFQLLLLLHCRCRGDRDFGLAAVGLVLSKLNAVCGKTGYAAAIP